MNIFPKRTETTPEAVDLDQLERDVRSGISSTVGRVNKNSSGGSGSGGDGTASQRGVIEYPAYKRSYTPIQTIGHAITKLTWAEAEKMGEGVKAKMSDNGNLTSAIQAWAAEWESWSSE